MRTFPLFVASYSEENTVYIIREDGTQIRVKLSGRIPWSMLRILTDEELKILHYQNLETWH